MKVFLEEMVVTVTRNRFGRAVPSAEAPAQSPLLVRIVLAGPTNRGRFGGYCCELMRVLVGLCVVIRLKREGKKHATAEPRQLTETQTSNP